MSNDTEEVQQIVEGEEEGLVVDDKGEVVKEERTGKAGREEERSAEDIQEENEELSTAETDDEREAIRARRREEKRERKQKAREREQSKDRLVASLQMQVRDLSERLSTVDRRQSGADYAKLEEELNQAIATANEAKIHLENAASAQDGVGVAEATELYYTARRRAEFLSGVKQKMAKGTQKQVPQLDNQVVAHASKWMRDNSWYKHGGDDTDSIITKAVDDQLVTEGFDPRTREYWDELNDRLSEKIPHRFNKLGGKTVKNTPPVGGSEKNSTSKAPGAGKFFLSADRIKALKDSGDWEDPVRREKMIKRYREFDKQREKE